MPRLKLELPRQFQFSTQLHVRIGDINYGGHLANDAVLALTHEARVRFLASFNASETNICGAGLIMTDAAVVYRAEARYGVLLLAETAIDDISHSGFDFFCRLSDSDTKQEIARVKTGMAFFDYQRHRPLRTPAEFLERFKPST